MAGNKTINIKGKADISRLMNLAGELEELAKSDINMFSRGAAPLQALEFYEIYKQTAGALCVLVSKTAALLNETETIYKEADQAVSQSFKR